MTTDTAGRGVPADAVLSRYRNLLAEQTERAIVAQAQAEAAEEECRTLRLQVLQLQGDQPGE